MHTGAFFDMSPRGNAIRWHRNIQVCSCNSVHRDIIIARDSDLLRQEDALHPQFGILHIFRFLRRLVLGCFIEEGASRCVGTVSNWMYIVSVFAEVNATSKPYDRFCFSKNVPYDLLDVGSSKLHTDVSFLLAFRSCRHMQGLEEEFDGTNRRNLHDFLIPNNVSAAGASSDGTHDGEDDAGFRLRRVSLTHRRPVLPGIAEDGPELARRDSLTFIDDEAGTEMDLVRIPTCAIFHNRSSAQGIPHAFYGFLRQLPALPELIVSVED